MDELKRQLDAAEKILAKRQIDCIEDLNIGDLSAFMEISVPMECLVGFHWEDYPNLNKLHQVIISHPQLFACLNNIESKTDILPAML